MDADLVHTYGRLLVNEKNHLDKLIAAHAVALDVILFTNIERDFASYPGVKIENWLNA
jgi:tRNA(fMet)-specific endonuclease VapC